jgi:hypothetical protein
MSSIKYISDDYHCPPAKTKQVPSYEMLGVPKPDEPSKAPPSPTPQHPLSPMGEACSRMDLTAIHQILFSMHYRDDEGSNEVKSTTFCFQHVLSAGLYIHQSPHCSYRSKNGHSK